MGSGRTYLAAFAGLHLIPDPDERRAVARLGLAMLAQIAEREPAPLEGLASSDLLRAVRMALADGVLAQLDWMSPAAGTIALFELAQALPPGNERRELGRRVLFRLREADRETFVRLLIALARSSPKLLASDGLRARAEVVLSAPLTAPGAIGELALGLLAQPALAESWIEVPATGSLPGRRLAARLLAHGAREAIRRHDAGDRGGVTVLARPGLRAALNRLLGDREALVWRFAGIARGLLAHADSDLAAQIDRELRPTASSTELRRASASAAAALERGGAATRWAPVLVERANRDPGVARGAILGLAGLAISAPAEADQLATELIGTAPLDGVEALAELRREEGAGLLPSASAAARIWTREQIARDAETDDTQRALLHELDNDLQSRARTDGFRVPLGEARSSLDAGDLAAALHHARAAVEEIAEAADWLERANDEDPIDRRHSIRLLRELDRELLADNTLTAVLALAPDSDHTRGLFERALGTIEAALLARESRAETGAVAHGGLRIARLRALVRLLDGVRKTGEADLGPRLAAVRQLMQRAANDHSTLRRAVWAALTRAGDALLRDDHAETTDLLLAWTCAFPDDDFAIVREATMIPEVAAAFDAYARLQQAGWAAADTSDTKAARALVERIGELADALPPEQSPRVESVRLALVRLGNQLGRLTAAASQSAVSGEVIEGLANEVGALARRVFGAQQRLGLSGIDRGGDLEIAVRAIGPALGGDSSALDEAIATAMDVGRACLPPAIVATVETVLHWLALRPRTDEASSAPAEPDVRLPSWIPLSRLLGSFYVVRPIGRGAGGSVLLAVRADERSRPDRELVAIKVPDYTGAARSLSEQEFEALFREEAGALLALPSHPNLAGFITFDASSRPKPILVMEFVRGTDLERTLEVGTLDMAKAFAIIDGLLAGIDAMHKVQIAHLDVKPANVLLRDGAGNAVLVDFGLAGRRLRPGCGSAHYGAAEVWTDAASIEPFGADVYAAAAVAYEVLTRAVMFQGDSLKEVIDSHFVKQPAADALAALEKRPRFAPLAQLLRAAVARDPKRRPTAARLRAGFAAIAPDLREVEWPIRA
ncbi:MAG: protein kinase [Kofleriaceae bacterium]